MYFPRKAFYKSISEKNKMRRLFTLRQDQRRFTANLFSGFSYGIYHSFEGIKVYLKLPERFLL